MKSQLALIALCSAIAGAQNPRGTIVVSNMNDNTAMLLDAASGSLLATLPTGEGPHEVATTRDGRWAVVSNYGVRGKPGNSITVIDVANRKVARVMILGEGLRPHGMTFLPGDSILVVTSETSRAVLLVDFQRGNIITQRPTGGRTSHMLAASAAGDVIVTGNISDGTISVIRTVGTDSAKIIRVAAQPEGIALTPDGNFAWVGSNRDSVVLVVDVRSARIVDTLRGFALPYRIAISRDGKTAVVTDPARAEVRVFDAATRRQVHNITIPRDSILATAEIPGSPSPEGVAISSDGRWAFVTLQGRNRLATIDLTRGVIVRLSPIGTWADGVAFSSFESRTRDARPSQRSKTTPRAPRHQ